MLRLTPVVKNLLIINVVVFALQSFTGDAVTDWLSLWKLESQSFAPYQFFTYMLAHGGIMHILFNMLGLVFLGPILEQFWGPKRFLTFYIITGVGAGMLYGGIEYYQTRQMRVDMEQYMAAPSPDNFNVYVSDHISGFTPEFKDRIYRLIDDFSDDENNPRLINDSKSAAEFIYKATLENGRMLGASGAVYGILMAFGLLFPNTELMLLFPPIPIKAKYLVLILGGIALYSGFQRNPGDQVAHFAHLGGMVFAFIMIKYWQSQRDKFY